MTVREGCTIEPIHIATPLARSISDGKKARRLTWLQADAIVGAGIVLEAEWDVPKIKDALKTLCSANKAGVFDVFVDEDRGEVKARKLPKMAAAFRAHLKAGKSVRIGGDSEGLDAAELRF